jgi:hypothetical protein
MNHILIIILLYLAINFVSCFYEYYYEKKILENLKNLENFEKVTNLGGWDDKISMQVLRDMLGIFFNESEKTFNIPGGLSVRILYPIQEIPGGRYRNYSFTRGNTGKLEFSNVK